MLEEVFKDSSADGFPEYEIPKEMLDRINPELYFAFAGEIFAIEQSAFEEADDAGNYYIHYLENTNAWCVAFFSACDRLGYDWLAEYFDSLEWFESDAFCSIFTELVVDAISHPGRFAINPYYSYLYNKYDRK